jgi:tryptophan synthase alpha chain
MSRIQTTFAQLQHQGKKALIPYIAAGDPNCDLTLQLMHAMAQSGADIIELGVPFSDPMADGPVVQRAAERALAQGVGLPQVLEVVQQFRTTNQTTPVVLMGYANPIERYNQRLGAKAFAKDAALAGVDGVLVVDYSLQECQAFVHDLTENDLDPIFLLAPTSTEQRIQTIGQLAKGYVYYVSLKGVTGAGHLDVQSVADKLLLIRQHVKLPIGVGFGINTSEVARSVSLVADAVVIGSRLIQILESTPIEGAVLAVRQFIAEVRGAIDRPS